MTQRIFMLFCFAIGIFSCDNATQKQNRNKQAEIQVSAKVIHPKSRSWMSPDGGIIPQFNPPSLLWPVSKNSDYSVRLSQQSDFTELVITAEHLPYAMFNPHEKLDVGKWYWQFKSSSGKWSETASFEIGENTQSFETPSAKEFLSKIPEDHPRVYAWKSELVSLVKDARNYDDFDLIISEADQFLKVSVIDEEEASPKFKGRNERENRKIAIDASRNVCYRVHQVVSSLAQAYLLTGDSKYSKTGMEWILSISKWDPEGATLVSDFGDSGIMHAMALGYDSFYDLLTKAQKEQLLVAISARGAHFFDDWINSLESRLLSNHVWQHILERLFQTALAVKGDLPIADKWLSYMYEIWIARAPILGYKDGSWSNGISYFRMNTLTMLSINSTLMDITGIDFMKNEWYYNNPEWMIYAWPPHGSADGFGNDAYKLGNDKYPKEANDPIFTAYPELSARLTGNPYAAWYVDKRIENTSQQITDDKSLRWFFVRKGLKLARPDTLDLFNLPQSRLFKEVGVAYLNTNLANTSKNLRLTFKSSPYGSYSHTHAEHNCFNLFYGGKPLFSNTGYRPAMGDPHYLADFKNTRGHNGILINGMGQPFGSEAYGWIPRFLAGEQLSYVVGDATNAYNATDASELGSKDNPAKNNADAGLKRFRRHIVLLKPNLVVIYDELETEQPSDFTFLLQNRDLLTIDEYHRVTASNEAAEVQAKVFSSAHLSHILTDKFLAPPENWRKKKNPDGSPLQYQNQWHYQATNSDKTNNIRFLAIMQVKAEKNGLNYQEIMQNDAHGGFTVGDWQINANLDVGMPAVIEIRKLDGSVAFTSSGVLESNDFPGDWEYWGSSKLIELKNGSPVFKEAKDELPESIANVLAILNKPDTK